MAAGLHQSRAPQADAPAIEAGPGDLLQPIPVDPTERHVQVFEAFLHGVEMDRTLLRRGDVDLTPIAPVAADLVLFDDLAKIGIAGGRQPIVAAQDFEVLDPARAVAREHEAGVAARGAVADAHRLDDGDGIVRTQLGQPPGDREPADAGADHRPVAPDGALDATRFGRRRKGFVPAVPDPIFGQLAGLSRAGEGGHVNLPIVDGCEAIPASGPTDEGSPD